MGQFFRMVSAVNFVASGFGISISIAYSFAHGRPVSDECLGIRAELGVPAWLACATVAASLLLLFFSTKKDWRQRLVIGAVGAWGLIWLLRLPVHIGVPPELLGTPDITMDRMIGIYACTSALLYGIIGAPRLWPFVAKAYTN